MVSSQSTQRLPDVIRRYGEVADMVNRREMNRFIAVIRSRWNPLPPEEEYRHEGWTSEGAFTKCVYDEAFWQHDKPRAVKGADPTEAEFFDQVQIKPALDEIMDFVAKPLVLPPLHEYQRRKLLEDIKLDMEQQAISSGVDATGLELPEDLEVLFSTVKGIRGAGVPSETAYTRLVFAFEYHHSRGEMPLDVSRRHRSECGRSVPIAALTLGGCEQHRSIHYVLSQPRGSTKISSEARWQIWDRNTYEIERYDDLAEWLIHETKDIEQSEGGGQRQLVLFHDRYPV